MQAIRIRNSVRGNGTARPSLGQPGGKSVDAGIRRLVLSLSVQRITPLEGQVLDFQ